MYLKYGSVPIRSLVVKNWDMKAVYDEGNTYLYHKHVITVSGLINPAETSLDSNLNDVAGEKAANTLVRIRQHLLQPRRKLLIYLGDVKVMEQPISALSLGQDPQPVVLPADANNGPCPVELTISEIHGFRTFVVTYTIEVCVNECGAVRAVLSHRWTMSEEIVRSEGYFVTRSIEGRAVFHSGVLHALVQDSPDDFRGSLFFPLQKGFDRDSVKVTVSPDGTQLTYIINESQASHIVGHPDVAYIEATDTFSNGRISPENKLRAVMALGGELWRATSTKRGRGAGRSTKGSGRSGLAQALGSVDQAIERALPRSGRRVDVLVQGKPLSTRETLTRIANAIIAIRILNNANTSFDDMQYTLTHHLEDRRIEASLTVSTSPLGNVFAKEGEFAIEDLVSPSPFNGMEDVQTPRTAILVRAETVSQRTGITLPNAKGTRGTRTEKLVAAALMGPCDFVDNITNPDTDLIIRRDVGNNTPPLTTGVVPT